MHHARSRRTCILLSEHQNVEITNTRTYAQAQRHAHVHEKDTLRTRSYDSLWRGFFPRKTNKKKGSRFVPVIALQCINLVNTVGLKRRVDIARQSRLTTERHLLLVACRS